MLEMTLVFLLFFPLIPYLCGLLSRENYFRPYIFGGALLAMILTVYAYAAGESVELILLQLESLAPRTHSSQETIEGISLLTLGLKLDVLSGLLVSTVLLIGAIIQKYSIRYLEDDPQQDRYLRNLSLTLTAVVLMMLSQNFISFCIAWMGSSYFLHQLLVHFSERPGAITAAKQKFWVSRLGDVFLVAAIIILYRLFGTFDFASIFALVSIHQSSPLLHLASFFLVLGAITKSAQFPFHFWLPNSLETPTPVSALMHAGIINAGGYLIIRMSPILLQVPLALNLLALIGGVTAFYGALAMLTQTNIKKQLAYSTIAQMGFMMLQCGLGAYAIATLHIIGHALYKAYAFLSSGNAIETGLLSRYQNSTNTEADNLWKQCFCLILSVAILFAIAGILQIEFTEKPGSFILTLILALAMAQTLLNTTSTGLAVWYASLICATYLVFYKGMSIILASSIPLDAPNYNTLYLLICGFVSSMFISLYLIQNNLSWLRSNPLGVRLYVGLYNGFYWGRI